MSVDIDFTRWGGQVGPLVVHVPHAGTAVPPEVRARLLLDDAGLEAELGAMTDRFTDRLATVAASRARVPVATFVNRLSRLVVDPERFPDEREPMEAIGMGAVYRVTSGLLPLRERHSGHRRDLLERYFHPFAERFADRVDDALAATGKAVIIDLHSYPLAPLPYEADPTAPRPQVCLGIDAYHTPGWLLEAATQAFDGYEVGVNSPFAGTYVPVRHYQRDPRVASVMIELRRDTYAAEPTGPVHEGFDTVADRLARLFELADALKDRMTFGTSRRGPVH